MIGAIAGDIIGSIYEGKYAKSKNIDLFTEYNQYTDDSILTIALADSILNNVNFSDKAVEYYNNYPNAGYGHMFKKWAKTKLKQPYNSWGNGSAMRVSPIGFAYNSLSEVEIRAEGSAIITHNHPDGIAGAKAIAVAIFMARTGAKKDKIREYIGNTYKYDLDKPYDEIREYNHENFIHFDLSANGTVPLALICFLDSKDYEDCIRNVLFLGGDTDTIACMAGGIAQAYYKKIPNWIVKEVYNRLNNDLIKIIESFNNKFKLRGSLYEYTRPI